MIICEVPGGILIEGVMFLVNHHVPQDESCELVRYHCGEQDVIARFEDEDAAEDFEVSLIRLARLGEKVEKEKGGKAVLEMLHEEAPDGRD